MELFIGALGAWGLITLVWTLVGCLLLPLRGRREAPMTVVLQVRGNAPWLRWQVRGVLWLRDTGLLWWDVVLLDQGMDRETQTQAQHLTAEQSQVQVMDLASFTEWMEEIHDGKGT